MALTFSLQTKIDVRIHAEHNKSYNVQPKIPLFRIGIYLNATDARFDSPEKSNFMKMLCVLL